MSLLLAPSSAFGHSCSARAEFSGKASSPPVSDPLSSCCCKDINSGQWARHSEILRVSFFLLHFFSFQMHFYSLGNICCLPKWFWKILGWTFACTDMWEVLGVPHHHPWLSSAPHRGTKLLGKVIAPVPMGPLLPALAVLHLTGDSWIASRNPKWTHTALWSLQTWSSAHGEEHCVR